MTNSGIKSMRGNDKININREVSRIIDNDSAIRKNLLDNLINISALARKIAKEHNLQHNIDAIISAIRRYEGSAEKKESMSRIYALLKDSKLSTHTRLISILLKKKGSVRKKLAELYAKIDFEGGDTMKIFEVTKYIKIVMDEKNTSLSKKIFDDDEIVETTNKLGEISINYNSDVTKIPGVFATLSNELASNQISIVDSMICYSEHLIIVHEKDLEKAFITLFDLTKRA